METLQTTNTKPKICLRTCCSKTFLALVSLVLIGLICCFMLVIWVATGPRSFEQFTPKVTEEINSQLDGYRIELDDILLTWESWESPLDARFKNAKLYSKQDRLLANLDQVAVSANVWALLMGELVLDRITIYKPTVNLYRKPSGDYILNLGYDTQYGPELPPDRQKQQPIKTLGQRLEQAQLPKLLGLTEFNIREGTINIGDTRRGIYTQLENVTLDSDIDRYGIKLAIDAELGGKEQSVSMLNASLNLPMSTLAVGGKLNAKNIHPAFLVELLPATQTIVGKDEVRALQAPVDVGLEFKMNEHAAVESAKFDISAAEGVISTDFFAQPLDIKSANIQGHISSGNKLVIDSAEIQTVDTTIKASADVFQREDEQLGIQIQASIDGLETSKVAKYWPPAQSPVSREWITSNITGGKISSANVKIDIKPGMLEWDYFPNEAISAVINFDGADVRFRPDFEKATNANGVVNVSANDLNVAIQKASFMEKTKLSAGTVYVDDLNADNPNITVKFSVTTAAEELAKVLANPSLGVAQEINMREDNVEGHIAGQASITFPFTLPRDKEGNPTPDAYEYDINASLQNVAQTKFLEEYDLTHVTGDLNVNHKKVEFSGTGKVFDQPLQIDVMHRLQGSQKVKTELSVFGNVNNAFLDRMGINLEEYAKGDMAVKANIQLNLDETMMVEGSSNLAESEVRVEQLAWQKPIGTPATVTFVAENNLVGTHISSIEFESGENIFEGSISLDAAGELKQLTATTLRLGENSLQLSYAPIVGGYKIYAKGDYFDASGFFDEEENFSFKDIPALDAKVDLKKLVLDDGQFIEDLSGMASCNTTICTQVAVSGKVGGAKPALMAIGYEGGQRKLKITSDDAGGLLNGLHVYENLVGGKININGVFNDNDPAHPLSGQLHIWDFEVYNTPTLARIVTLASFGGIIDALQGNGLSFDKMQSEFVLNNDVIAVKGMRMTGDSLGITADGMIDLPTNTLLLKGVVIPSYTINSFLKNVPIVGDILTGGEAIIAANYKVDGEMEEPDVSVNPLSALAPGFLRKIFE